MVCHLGQKRVEIVINSAACAYEEAKNDDLLYFVRE